MSQPRRYGLDPQTWQDAKAEVRAILIETARQRQLITYGQITERLQCLHAHPGSYVFTALLREVCADVEREGGGMVCALVVTKADGRPGAGYWRGMPCPQGDLEACWRAECEVVWDIWSKNP
ncbi:MAG: hypothetical protein NZ750_12825 [Anaerolineae bacterium]|nr:hypothetical protein [Anaerolineae bacterium]MDW8173659.1 hypothetical protein [Anaerolineae bacterium]